MIGWLKNLEGWPRPGLVLAGLGLLGVIGLIDYLTGYEMFFSVFYLIAVGMATWFVGRRFGFLLSILSVVVGIGGDLAAGARFNRSWVPIWNAVILLVFYFVVVWLLTSLRTLKRELEVRVGERTQALTREMAERQRLEEEILAISEREQRRMGHDLHDGLCQHLTATALAGQVLDERLSAQGLPEAADAAKVVRLVEEGINLARSLARGLYPVEMEAEGLMTAFQDLADNISQSTKVDCVFECHSPVLIHDDGAAAQLYRIAQEAVRNALQHGRPKRIGINLYERNGQVTLAVEDDGTGFPDAGPKGPGLGIRIMAHRAAMIGGRFGVEPAPTGGTIVTCSFPATPREAARTAEAGKPQPQTV